MWYSHPVWAKPVYGLSDASFVTSLGFRCLNADCRYPRTVYRSAQAESLTIKGSTYGLDVVVHIGHLWLQEHRTRSEIHALLRGQVLLSERHVQNLFEGYLALLRCDQARTFAQLPALAQTQGGLVLSLDGLRPENGNESLYVLRDVLSGLVLWADCLQEADHATLAAALKPVADLHLPILGVISDIQKSIRLAVAEALPGVPLAFCHLHVLREAAKPIFEADRHMKKKIKIGGSGWIAARCYGQPDHPASYVAAHTSPVYVKCGDTRAFDGPAAEHMLALVEGGMEYLQTIATVFDEPSRHRMVKLFKEAQAELKGRLVVEARHPPHHGDGAYHTHGHGQTDHRH